MRPSTIQAARSIGPDLRRYAAALLVAAALTLSLGVIFPAQFVLDTAGYRATTARTWAPMSATDADLEPLSSALGGERVALVLDMMTEVSVDGRSFGPISVWGLLGKDVDPQLTLLPASTRVDGEPRGAADEGRWIDINVDIAAALEVGPGDQLQVLVGPDDRRDFTVRGVYAARENGFAGLAVTSALAISDGAPEPSLSTSLVTTASVDAVSQMLDSPPWSDRMESHGYSLPIQIESSAERLALAEEDSFADMTLVVAVSVLALGALVAISIGESVALMRAFRSRAKLLTELGARATSVQWGGAMISTFVAAMSVFLGASLGLLAYTWGVVGPTLPTSITPYWWFASAVGAIAASAAVSFTAARHRKELAP
ncbi:MAG: hypothetical protein EOO27_35795 [Comamonadaceae bacterium]|nr:MAG: hypothetical protein EOO27_35795 [Comamonadaceae bacterium]